MKGDVLDNIKEQVQTKRPRDIYRNCDLIDGPRNEKQVRDALNHLKKLGSTQQDSLCDTLH
jgi:hypothetical protein